MAEHQFNATKYHLSLALDKIAAQGKTNFEQAEEIKALKRSQVELKDSYLELLKTVTNLKDQGGVWEIPDFDKKVSKENSFHSMFEKEFYTPEGYKLRATLYPKRRDDTCSLYIGIIKGAFDDNLEWPMSVNIKCVLVANKDNKDKEWIVRTSGDIIRNAYYSRPPHNYRGIGVEFIAHCQLPNFLSDGTLTLRITTYQNSDLL